MSLAQGLLERAGPSQELWIDFFLLETESHYEAEVGLELVAIPLPLPLNAGITGMSRHFWLDTLCF